MHERSPSAALVCAGSLLRYPNPLAPIYQDDPSAVAEELPWDEGTKEIWLHEPDVVGSPIPAASNPGHQGA